MTTPEKVNNTKSSKIKINESNHTSLTETGKSGTGMNESQLIMLYIYQQNDPVDVQLAKLVPGTASLLIKSYMLNARLCLYQCMTELNYSVTITV